MINFVAKLEERFVSTKNRCALLNLSGAPLDWWYLHVSNELFWPAAFFDDA
jgi:hypothetical protein